MEPKTDWYVISLCDACVAGEGGECHTPGCALWCKSAPDVKLDTGRACIKMTERELAAFNAAQAIARGEW
jgi:hypothetical protein